MTQRWWRLALPALLALASGEAATQATRFAGEIPHERYRLENGLTVILAPEPTATAVAVNVWYDVGSRHERAGRTGFAHLFEHLMFEGSDRVPRGTFDRLINQAGGSANASVTEDRTNYFQTVPSGQMNVALWLEADRMDALLVTEENLRREGEVVKEERRFRVDNAAYGVSGLVARFYAAYDAATCFPYAHSVIGSMEDLEAARLEDVQEFFDTYYAPNNATLTVVGAFDADTARALVHRYFSGIRRGPEPPEPVCEAPFSHLPVRREIEDVNARLPAISFTFGTVAVGDPDSYALGLLAAVLGVGETSRLHRRLVREERAALNVSASSLARRGPGIFVVSATANEGVDVERLGALLEEEIERVAREGIDAAELRRVQNRARAQAVLGRQTVLGRAETLQWHNHFLGDPGAYRTEMERMLAVTPAAIQEVARRYLIAPNRAVIVTRPAAQEAR